MKISASFLSIKDNFKENIEKLDKTNIDYLHVDIMDGEFVTNKTWDSNQISLLLQNTNKPRDIHLMVSDVKKNIDDFIKLNPEFITFHIEAVEDPIEIINYIKNKNIKVGISLKPNTNIDKIYNYLHLVDLVLVMCVEPGRGGQEFIFSSIDKINKLIDFRKQNNLEYLIEVDGGINDRTIGLVRLCDIAVVGSYITNNDYEESVNKLKN